MPTLTTDIIGRVRRLPLKPSATSALMPLFETVSNGLHAIEDRFGDKARDLGKIEIEVIREDPLKYNSSICGFVVTDNGIGLDDCNYASFLKPDSQHKFQRGGKGVGRLGWLKVFQNIRVDSTYIDTGGQPAVRSFDFLLREDEQVLLRSDVKPLAIGTGTRVNLKTFDSLYGGKCPVEAATLQQRIIGHFMQLLVSGLAPSIIVSDSGEPIDLRVAVNDMVRHTTEEKVNISLNDGSNIDLSIRHIRAAKAIRPDANKKAYNWLFLAANDRAVEESVIDDAIGLKALDDDDIYIGCVSGDHLDAHVNQERTGFIFSSDESREIRRALLASVMTYLDSYVSRLKERKRQWVKKTIEDYPQFLYLNGEMEAFIDNLAPSVKPGEAIFVEMCRHRYRRMKQEHHKIDAVVKSATDLTASLDAKMTSYQAFVQDQQKGVLAEYVLLRRSIIDILDRYSGYQEGTAKQHFEEAVHKLIVPMRTDSASMEIGDHNLWLIDDRLAFFAFFASDKRLKSYTDNPSKDRPDISFFYDTCFAWREQDAANTVVLVEFKRPSRDDYGADDNPLKQVIRYIKQFKQSTSLKDTKGRQLSPNIRNAAFHCYIIADITGSLRESTEGFSFHDTPDGQGLVGYLKNPDAFVEVISYSKLLADAKMRNSIFFQKLGITNIDRSIANETAASSNTDEALEAEQPYDGTDTVLDSVAD